MTISRNAILDFVSTKPTTVFSPDTLQKKGFLQTVLILDQGLNTPPPDVTFRPISEPYVKSVSMIDMFPQRPWRRAGSALTGVNVPREREMRRGGEPLPF